VEVPEDQLVRHGRAVLVVFLVGVFAACDAGAASSSPVAPAMSVPAATGSPPATTATAAASPSSSPSASSKPAPTLETTPKPVPTSVAPPPKPTGVTFRERKRLAEDPSATRITQTVRWRAPRSPGAEVRVFGVTECLAMPANPAPSTHGPCLVEHTRLPASIRVLLARAPAANGVVRWSWRGDYDWGDYPASDPDGPFYHAVVLATYNASGHSSFAIAAPGGWYAPGPDEVIC
jgi:hypothetical protein